MVSNVKKHFLVHGMRFFIATLMPVMLLFSTYMTFEKHLLPK